MLYYLKKESNEEKVLDDLRNLEEVADYETSLDSFEVLESELDSITSLLKTNACIEVSLVPEDLLFQDMKTFSWKLEEFNDQKLRIKIQFDFPEFISVDT